MLRFIQILIVFLILSPTLTFAGDDWRDSRLRWDHAETIMATTWMLFHYADYTQTLQIKDTGMYELNPILGKHPTDFEITLWFGATSFFGIVIADQIKSHTWRKIWLGVLLASSVYIVHYNEGSGGLQIKLVQW